MNIDEIKIGTKWKDSWGIQTFHKNGQQVVGLTRIVTILDKTSNSISYMDTKGFISWIVYDEFIRVERAINKIRFVKID
jgi:hypothetical protein